MTTLPRTILGSATYVPEIRAERAISAARAFLAAGTGLALTLNPMRTASYGTSVVYLVAVYSLLAGLGLWLAWRVPARVSRMRAWVHLVDVIVAFSLVALTGNIVSPLQTFLFFILAAGTVRWGATGAVASTVAIGAFLALTAGYYVATSGAADFETDRFVFRTLSLSILAAFFWYTVVFEGRLRKELAAIASWPRISGDDEEVARLSLERAAEALGASRLLLVWELPEEPRLQLASFVEGKFDLWDEPAGDLEPLVAQPIRGSSFVCVDADSPLPAVVHTSSAGPSLWQGRPVHPMVEKLFPARSIVGNPLQGEFCSGYLFMFGKRLATWDDVLIAGMVASQIGEGLDQQVLARRRVNQRLEEDRAWWARELHDGVLQSMGAAALQLQSAVRDLDTETDRARERLRWLQRFLVEEQRGLRFKIAALRPGLYDTSGPDGRLGPSLVELARRIEDVWGLKISCHLETVDGLMPLARVQDICGLVQEALVNCARHADATSAQVEVARSGDRLVITVGDNGHGFSFEGYFDDQALADQRLGPVMLKERVREFAGRLAIESSKSGSRLYFNLPYPQQGA